MPPVAEFIADVSGQVHPDDAALFDILRFPADNRNLLALLEKRDEPFDPAGGYSSDELAAHVKVPDALPSYMQAFIEAHAAGKLPSGDLSADNQLAGLFYDEMCAHRDPFISQWFTFDLDMRNVCAALNCRRAQAADRQPERAFMLQHAVIGGSDVAQAILKSTAPDFSLSAQLPWVERIVNMDRENPVEFEKNLDMLRWDRLNELTLFSYFSFDAVLSFTIKLGTVQRWQGLDEQSGKEALARLVKELTSHYA
jgi:hypothetical protein